jgi:hypothetical protein
MKRSEYLKVTTVLFNIVTVLRRYSISRLDCRLENYIINDHSVRGSSLSALRMLFYSGDYFKNDTLIIYNTIKYLYYPDTTGTGM